MEGGEGMVAVVRGLRDSNLTVTLLDGSKQYTLVPSDCSTLGWSTAYPTPAPAQLSVTREHLAQPVSTVDTLAEAPAPTRCDSTVQATDARYATMYKTAHCRVVPTSPPVQLTEFPPQRAELCRGQGNFEVGGLGSGENFIPNRSVSFRGGMNWSERGAVCSPRQSREPDAFANSLRKYPAVSPERSTEIVERLITYTQQKNSAKSFQHRQTSPIRHGVDANQVLDRNFSKNSVSRNHSFQRSYEKEVSIASRGRYRVEESPTRDLPRHASNDYDRRSNPTDGLKKTAENTSGFYYPYNQTCCPVARERCDYQAANYQRSPFLLTSTNSVNMEVQAAAEMVSKQVATFPRIEPIKRNVAVPLSPTTSSYNQKPTGEVFGQFATKMHKVNENKPIPQIAPHPTPIRLSVQNTSSAIQLTNKKSCIGILRQRRSKSEDIINFNKAKNFEMEIWEILENMPFCILSNQEKYDFRAKIIKLLQFRLQSRKFENPSEIAQVSKIRKTLKYVPDWVRCSSVNTRSSCNKDELKINNNNFKTGINVNHSGVYHGNETKDNNLDDIIMSWIKSVPIKTYYIAQTQTNKEDILQIYVSRIKHVISNKIHRSTYNELKTDLINFISKIPLDSKASNKAAYLSNIVDNLLTEIIANSNRISTAKELKYLISDELNTFLKQRLSLHKDKEWVTYIKTELTDILIESIQVIRRGNESDILNEIIFLLHEVGGLAIKQSTEFSKSLLSHVKEMFSSINKLHKTYNHVNALNSKKKLNTLAVNYCQATSIDFQSILKEVDLNLDTYIIRLTYEIEEWLENINSLKFSGAYEKGLKAVVVNDLARDIIDRYKYLDLNPSTHGSDDDELEYLKYQIFKWINKLVGDDNTETIAHAAELFKRIKNIIPTCKNPQKNQPDAKLNRQVNLVVSTSLLDKQTNKNTAVSCCQGTQAPPGLSLDRLNDEYDQFVKNWINEIPIAASTPEEQALADKLRLGLYNGVWKAITKLKFQPTSFSNSFYYEDAFDDELDELLSSLPDNPELIKNKHLLKVKLIEKTTNTRGQMKFNSAPASFKQQLIDNVSNNLPLRCININKVEDPLEKIQILRLVEDFILFTRYKEENQAKAYVYRKKLINEVDNLIKNFKKVHGKELKNIDTELYTNNIFSALLRVPLPKEEILREEAYEIQMGIEVEQWFSDLPLAQNDDQVQEKCKRKIRKALVRRIKEIHNLDCSREAAFIHEISLMLEKLPFQKNDNLNFSYMAEELANRMKNKAKQIQTTKEIRKSIVFADSLDYDAFGQDMAQGCSSFAEISSHPSLSSKANRRGSSFIMRDGYRFDISEFDTNSPSKPQYLPRVSPSSPVKIPSDQFITLEDSQNPQASKSFKPQGSLVLPKQQQQINQHSVQDAGQVPYILQEANESYKTIPESSRIIQMESLSPSVRNETSYKALPGQSIVQVPLQLNSGQRCQSDKQPSSCCQSAANSMQLDPQYQQSNQSLPISQNVLPVQVPIPGVSGFNQVSPQVQPHQFVMAQRQISHTLQPMSNQMASEVVFEGQPQVIVPISPKQAVNNSMPSQHVYAQPVANSVQRISNGNVGNNVSFTHKQPDISLLYNHRPYTESRQGMYGSILDNQPVIVGTSPIQQGGYISIPVNQLTHAEIQNSQGQSMQGVNLGFPQNGLINMNTSNQLHNSNEIHFPAESYPAKQLLRPILIAGVQEGNEINNAAGQMTTYGQPQGFSTPQQVVTQETGTAPRPGRKKTRNQHRRVLLRRRLDLEDETEEETDEDERCFCMDRMWRRLRPFCYAYEDFQTNNNHCYSAPFGSPYYY